MPEAVFPVYLTADEISALLEAAETHARELEYDSPGPGIAGDPALASGIERLREAFTVVESAGGC